MAIYAISQEGIESLEKLAKDLKQVTADIDYASYSLLHTVEGIEDGLGIFTKDILEHLRYVFTMTKKGNACIEYLADISIPEKIKSIEECLIWLGEESGDDEDQPPQKKLVLRRR